jgi:hypothetical protein
VAITSHVLPKLGNAFICPLIKIQYTVTPQGKSTVG